MGNALAKKVKRKPKAILNWFEIPVLDMTRAVSFYNYLFAINLEITELPEYAMAPFPEVSGVGGALVLGQGCTPSETGALLYLNATDDMNDMLDRVEKAGGRVIMGKTDIGEESGSFSLFIDSEGNKLALHSSE